MSRTGGGGDEPESGGAEPRSAQDRKPTAKSESGLITGVGASAGGLEAFTELLRNLPATTGMAFVLVQHLDPYNGSILADLLRNDTRMPVIQVQGEIPAEPDRVYVMPPNATMVIGDRELTATEIGENFVSEALLPGKYVWLEVKDTGSGMDEATKARIFDPFFTTKLTGRGLGLAAVSGILRALHGAIRVYSTPGHGTTFYILFPTAAAAASPWQAKRLSKPKRGSGTILVIDDEDVVRQSVRWVLEKSGFEVLLAENGQAGVDLFRAQTERISLVILDLTMPVMGGERAVELLRAIRSDIPILLASGYDESDAFARTSSNPLAGFLQKPFDATRLSEAVASALGLRQD